MQPISGNGDAHNSAETEILCAIKEISEHRPVPKTGVARKSFRQLKLIERKNEPTRPTAVTVCWS